MFSILVKRSDKFSRIWHKLSGKQHKKSFGEERIEYNANGFPSKRTIVAEEDGSILNELIFSYSGNKATYETKNGKQKGEYQLDDKGRATQEIISNYDSDGKLMNRLISKRTYSAEGYLIKEEVQVPLFGGYENVNSWENGNLIKSVLTYSDGSSSTSNYEYYTDKTNQLESIHSRIEFKGTAPKNLIKSELDGETGKVVRTYVYEYDAAGKPKKKTATKPGSPSSYTASYS